MPKPLSVTVEVEEIALGRVIRILNRTPGVVRFNLNLQGDRPEGEEAEGEQPHGNTGRTPRKGKIGGRRIMLGMLAQAKGKPVSAKQFKPVFEGDGISHKSVHTVAHILKKIGHIKQVDIGTYVMTPKGKAAWEKESAAHAAAHGANGAEA